MIPFLPPFQKKYNTECVIYSKIKTTIYMSKNIYAFKVAMRVHYCHSKHFLCTFSHGTCECTSLMALEKDRYKKC